MIHYITLNRLPQYNNELLTKHYSRYKNGDLIAVRLTNQKVTYYYYVHGMQVFDSIADFIITRTFSNNHRI